MSDNFREEAEDNLKALAARRAAIALGDPLRITEMTIEEFRALPQRGSWSSDEGLFSGVVLLPTEEIHDSGYRCMDLVGCLRLSPVCRLAGGSDVIHLNGTGGTGWMQMAAKALMEPSHKSRYGTVGDHGWVIDCLPKSGLMYLRGALDENKHKLEVGHTLSSIDIYCVTPWDPISMDRES